MEDFTFNSLLIHSCTIYRRSTSEDSVDKWGAPSETISESSSSSKCLFQQRSEDVVLQRRGEKIISRYIAFFKITEDILEDDVIEFGSKKYQVISVEDAAGQGHHLEVGLKSLEN